ncbi:hypothetical protein B0J12DRAFT_586384 [Macrophomina phaseolina]|uniref:Short-chain dehydrogenase/reductase SDR n=1 Tax=Macrophomina phaseolina TaxID=35725 RepID=A0ABQ8FRB8_9PEZI|nr:hypothetical protein B0J12DRAFT_586384 [Macrophomina phaseolina]
MTSLPPVRLSPPVGIEDCNKTFQDSSFTAKKVLITGGASGVGAAIAQTFAEKGAYVTIVDVAKELGTQVADNLHSRGHHAQFIHANITSWPSILSAFKTAATFHPAHTLTTVIACAGVLGTPFILPTERPLSPGSSPSASTSVDDPPAPDVSAITINAIGLTYTCKLAQLFFEAAPTPPGPSPPKSLLIFTSMLAYTDFHNSATYTASKHAARGLFRILRPLLSARGHRVNAVAPWLTRTPMTDGKSGGVSGCGGAGVVCEGEFGGGGAGAQR